MSYNTPHEGKENYQIMKKQTKIIVSVVAVIAVICILAGVYKVYGPQTSAGEKKYTVKVVDADDNVKTYTGTTDAEDLRDLMDELTEEGDFSYDGSESEYGLYITEINDEEANYDEDGAYWSIYVDGEYGQYGADSQPVEDGGEYEFVYETYDAAE